MSSVLETFNAKHHDSEKLISTFVPSNNFRKTAQNGHTIIIGPRGSGKTTLLRMLTIPALHGWVHDEADEYREKIKYEGIYVPGDVVWEQMIKTLERAGIEDECAKVFTYTSFATHVFYSLMDSLDQSLALFMSENDEGKMSKISSNFTDALFVISRILKLDLSRVSIPKIRSELNIRLNELGEYSALVVETKELTLEKLRKDLPYSTIEIRQALESILSEFDNALGRPEHKWALLLDEFEIAPPYLLVRIITNMRSSAKKLMLKVALVPCGNQVEIEAAIGSNHDYQIVELWYRKKGESKKFCEDILSSTFGIKNPKDIFGKTNSDLIVDDDGGPAVVDGGAAISCVDPKELNVGKIAIFNELYEKDENFRKYIDDRAINIEQVFSLKNLDSSIRKMTPIVVFRNEFLGKDGKRKGKPSAIKFYTGWDAITRISEGNPRWLIATISNLLSSNDGGQIEPSKQFVGIKSSTDAFAAMIASTARKNNMGISTEESPFNLIKQISDYFKIQILDTKFSPDPSGTFIVDKNTPIEVEKALKIALNHGAIVALDQNDDIWDFKKLFGKRFRLSYLFSPYFNLPLRMEKSVNLSTILVDKHKREDMYCGENSVDSGGLGSQGEIKF